MINNTAIGRSRTSAFLKKFRVVIVSVVLILVSLHLALTDKTGTNRGVLIDDVISFVVSPVQKAVVGTQRAVTGAVDDYVMLVDVNEENERLKKELLAVREENNRLAEEALMAQRLKESLEYKTRAPFSTTAASILALNVDRWTRTMTLDKGSRDGLAKDMAVIAPTGVVGRIIDVAPGTSTVLLTTDLRSNIESIVQRTRVKGVVEGSGSGGMKLKYVRELDDVNVGDRVITSGFSGLFPKGLVIGEVVRIEKGQDNFFKSIGVRPAVDFTTIEEVLVVTAAGASGGDGPAAEGMAAPID